jgi:hypothetical protein
MAERMHYISKITHLSFIAGLVWMIGILPGAAQNVAVSASTDSTLMFIGGQMKFNLEVSQPEGYLVIFPHLTDTITKEIEIVEIHKRDTTVLDNRRLLIRQMYTITSFDSGLHYIPPMRIEYQHDNQMSSAATQSMALLVVNPFAEVDPEKGFFDLKLPFTLPFIITELLKYWYLVLLFNLIQAIIGLYIVYRQTRKIPVMDFFFKEKPKELPHVHALRELDRIKSEKLWQKGQIKTFYSQLTDTLRHYLEERYRFPAMEQTSGEILKALKRVELPDSKLYGKIEKVLDISDLAKFAKYEPLQDENDHSLISAYFFINQTKEEPVLSAEEAAKKSHEDEEGQNKIAQS